MKLKKLIAIGLMAVMPFALGACAEEGDPDPVGDTAVDDPIVDDTTDPLVDDTVTEDTMTEDTMTEDTMTEDTAG